MGTFNGSKVSYFSQGSMGTKQSSSLCFMIIILLLSGDVHKDPGPTNDRTYSFSVCFWNLNSISVNNFAKLSLLASYNSIYSYDLICLSETYLDSSFLPGDERLNLNVTPRCKERWCMRLYEKFISYKSQQCFEIR